MEKKILEKTKDEKTKTKQEGLSQEKKKAKRKKKNKQILLKYLFLVIILCVLLKFIVAIRVAHTNDMYPSICDGQAIIFNRLKTPKVGEVVLYEINGDEKIGRIVAQENDTVEFDGSGFKVNGSVPFETLPFKTEPAKEGQSITVPERSYYILNDYRERKNDSRQLGCISNIKGVVIFTMKYRDF